MAEASGNRQAIFLDRDGVLNAAVVRDGKPYPPSGLADMEILPGVPDACALLRQAGFKLIVVTNQPDIARGRADAGDVMAINAKIVSELQLDDCMVCPHDDGDGCNCRKPLPGLLLTAAERHAIDLSHSVMVGDRWRDVEAGRAAGCLTAFIDYGYRERQPEQVDFRGASLADLAPRLLSLCKAKKDPGC